MNERRVTIGFFRARGCGQCFQKYEHVELRFSDGTTTSITSDPGRVHYDQYRVLSNEHYACFMSVGVTKEQEEAMMNLAWDHHNNGTGFNRIAMYWNFVCCLCPIRTKESVFCSQYVVILLQAANLLLDLDPSRTSPTSLYKRISQGEDGFIYSVNTKKKRYLEV